MMPFMDLVKVKQETQRDKTNVEEWLDQLNPLKELGMEIGDRKPSKILYTKFREYENEFHPSTYKTSVVHFGRQMSAIKNSQFKKTKQNGYWSWEPATPPADDDDEQPSPADLAKVLRIRKTDPSL
jgi:hypothetical protein